MIKLSKNAMLLLKKRYLLKDKKGKIIEKPDHLFRRVARYIAAVDRKYRQDPKKSEKEFYNVMSNLDFLPNSPTLMNAGTEMPQLSACFVLPIEDSLESIFETLKEMAIIHQSGGGTGFNFSHLRQRGSLIAKSKGKSSGPVSFIEIYNKATDVIKQGGRRRGANIGILDINHPDILDFIHEKQMKSLRNFGLSVSLTDEFMDDVEKDKNFHLIDPKTRKIVKTIKARQIFDALVNAAWHTGDPGILFIDEINRKNKLKLGRIRSTNPCGEVPLYEYESCILGSVNLSNMIKDEKIDWNKLAETVHIGVHFLDNVIDANEYPFGIIEKTTKSNRKIGLGVMGFAEMLIKLKIPYESERAVEIADKVMSFIDKESKLASIALAKKRGPFPNIRKSKYKMKIRNATTTTIAPTGSLSLIADTSSGIEPLFAVKYRKNVLGKEGIWEYNKLYRKYEQKYRGRLPKDIALLFKSASAITKEQHVKVQAAFQRHTDNAVSKTVNLKNSATKNDVKKVFLLAHKLKCKGITVYRDQSSDEKVIEVCEVCEI